jgi:hypothetical protein
VANGLPKIVSLAKGERVMLERKKLDSFYHELQLPSRVRVNTQNSQPQEREEDAKTQLIQS